MKTLLLILLLSFPILSQTTEETYRQIDQPISIAERKAIFRTLPEEARYEVWRIHFRKFLKGKLDRNQKSILRRLMAARTKEEVRAIEPEIRSSFPYELGRRIFYTIGPAPTEENVARCGEDQQEIPEMGVNCVCTTASYNYSCPDACSSGQTCSTVAGNCGIMWLFDCNGMCSCGG
jgi:hypothetical protein